MRLLVVTAGGLGLIKPAPGTWGSAGMAALAFVLVLYAPVEAWWILLLIAAAASLSCIWLTPWAEKHFGQSDPGEVVIDEVAGMSLAGAFSPVLLAGYSPASEGMLAAAIIVSFGWFRVFDILKPPPIDLLQCLSSGWGVLLDDILAGVIAASCTWATLGLAGMLPAAACLG
ncbi:MAG: phosphatidylglycerophosphatase A [Phycisphaerales bacterium]|nr:phosphatidylglycerophosphatase A [Phycisphaerales bacterium]